MTHPDEDDDPRGDPVCSVCGTATWPGEHLCPDCDRAQRDARSELLPPGGGLET